MSASSNPYHPPDTETGPTEFHGRMKFSGTIEEADYCALLPTNDLELFGWGFFESPLVTFFVPLVVTLSLQDIAVKWLVADWYSWWLLTVCTLLVTFAIFHRLQRSYNRKAIAARQLKQNPDLLGTAEGELTAEGMLFFDGTHHYWFSPSALHNCVISRRGVRARVDANPFRFLALTPRLFEAFDANAAKQLFLAWKQARNSGKQPTWQLWNQVGQAPENAIRFRYKALTSELPKQEFLPPIGTWDIVSLLFLVAVMMSNFRIIGRWIMLAYFVFLAFSMLVWTPLMRRWAKARPVQEFTQFAWITPEDFATYNYYSAVRLPTDRLNLRLENEELISGSMQGQPFHIPRAVLDDPDDWERLCALINKPRQ